MHFLTTSRLCSLVQAARAHEKQAKPPPFIEQAALFGAQAQPSFVFGANAERRFGEDEVMNASHGMERNERT